MDPQLNRKLSEAIEAGDVAAVRRIVAARPEVLSVDWGRGRTWLHNAAGHDNPEVVAALVDAGLDVNVGLADEPQTPLHMAAMNNCVRVAQWLLEHGARIDVGGGALPTPLSYAAGEAEGEPMVRLLVDRGANLNLSHGYPVKNPLWLARKWKNEANEKILRERGALLPWEMPEWRRAEPQRAEILLHLENALGRVTALPREQNDPVQVVVATAGERVGLATAGLSARAMERVSHPRIELIFDLPRGWESTPDALAGDRYGWPLQWLRNAVQLVMTGKGVLDEGHTLATEEADEPLGPDVKMSAILFLRELRPFGRMQRSDGEEITFLSLFPIYASELALKESSGVVALIKALQAAGIPPRFEPKRKAAVSA